MSRATPVSLDDAVDALYRLTLSDRPTGEVDACRCGCIRDDERRALQATPREHLGAVVLRRYAFKALSTWGNEGDLRWFMPRIVELMAIDLAEAPPAEAFAAKLVDGGLPRWPPAVRDAIGDAYAALWDAAIGGGHGCAGVLAGALTLGLSAETLLARWQERARREPSAALSFAELVTDACTGRRLGRPHPGDAVLVSAATHALVDQLFFAFAETEPAVATTLSRAHDSLGWTLGGAHP